MHRGGVMFICDPDPLIKYCGMPDPPCLSKISFVLTDMLGIVV